MGRGRPAALVASPVLVGAVTVLISIIAVFIAYNANRGLPFVPTYELKAELPSGAKLVKGNEVRVGGFRVGVVDDIQPQHIHLKKGHFRTIAVVDLKLDKVVEPLRAGTTLRVRPRSVLGLKYIQLTPGRRGRPYAPGDTIPLKAASEPLELEDLFSTFEDQTRVDAQDATAGFGDAFAGRGASLNEAIGALNPFFRYLTPVMQNLSDPDTRLENFFRQLGRASAQAAPVARTQAVLFTHMADTFAAISRYPRQLQQTIEKSPPTLDASIRSFRVQRPFLADFADLSRRLIPAARELPRSLPKINRALAVGTPILRRQPELNNRLASLNRQLEDLFENPNTLLALRDLRTNLTILQPALKFVAPSQTVCNYSVNFLHGLGEHMSQVSTDKLGTTQNQALKNVNDDQPNRYSAFTNARPVDIGPDTDLETPGVQRDPRFAKDEDGEPLHRFYWPPYGPAIDSAGNADCQTGQEGYPRGPLDPLQRYGTGTFDIDNDPSGNSPNDQQDVPRGGNWGIRQDNLPLLSGGTYLPRRLGIGNVRDVEGSIRRGQIP